MFKPGDNVRDLVSGFTGRVTARCEYIHSPARIEITGLSVDGKEPPVLWVEEARCETRT